MIPLCKEVGYAREKPCGDRVYFLTRYLIHETKNGTEILEVVLEDSPGIMREIKEVHCLAHEDEVVWHPDQVQIHDQALLLKLARANGKFCTIFRAFDEHLTFVLDPDSIKFMEVHVYDIIPPRPSLAATLEELERDGLFSGLRILFNIHITDIRNFDAEVFPCRAAGFSKTLDIDVMRGGEKIAGCLTGDAIFRECYGDNFQRTDTCPLPTVREEPFLARCCRKERCFTGIHDGRQGSIVHWGASPREILSAVEELVQLRRKDD